MSKNTTTTTSDTCPDCGHAWSLHRPLNGCQGLREIVYPCGCRNAPPSVPSTPPEPAA